MIALTTNQFVNARNAKVPLIGINTPDPASSIQKIRAIFPSVPIAQWDIINGVVALTSQATAAVNKMNTVPDGMGGSNVNPALATGNPVEALMKLKDMPTASIVFFQNAHLYMERTSPGNMAAPVIQAIWNLRDIYKKSESCLVMLCPTLKIPDELQHDVIMIDEPLPTDIELASLITKTFTAVGINKPAKKLMPDLVDATSGLSSFAVEQVIRMSVTRGKRSKKPQVNVDQLWKRKIDKIETVSGLRIHRTGPRFSDIGGNDNIKDILLKIARSNRKPRLVVFIDEIEKALAAAGTDTTGVSTDQLKVLLTEMQNNQWTGLICYGIPGTGKSELAKAFGHEVGAPTVEADLGAMKNIWVGSSEARMRSFVKIIKAMGDSRVFFFATCNHVEILRPELKRRFIDGIWYSDIPNKQERDKIWEIKFKKYNIPSHQEKPNDEGWAGAEIDVCCRRASELGIPLIESSKFMTITSQAMGNDLKKMRQAASGKYISTQHPGVYTYTEGK